MFSGPVFLTLKQFGIRASRGAAAGAVAGLAIDAAVGGTSLGAGAAIGATIGALLDSRVGWAWPTFSCEPQLEWWTVPTLQDYKTPTEIDMMVMNHANTHKSY